MLANEPGCCLNTLLIRRPAQSRARKSDKAITMTGTQNAFSPFVMVKLCKWSYQDRKHEPQTPVWVKLVLLATNWKSAILYISGTAINWSFPVSRMSRSHRHRAQQQSLHFLNSWYKKPAAPWQNNGLPLKPYVYCDQSASWPLAGVTWFLIKQVNIRTLL